MIATPKSVSYGIRRNVPAENEAGAPCRIALVVIRHENGARQTLAINEALISMMGERVIEEEIAQACASPADIQFRKALN